jgi:hypothetical protein
MNRTSLFLDARTLADLKRVARRRNVSMAMLIREAVSAYLAEPATEARLPSIAGRFSSGRKNTSANVDKLLWRNPHK